MQQAQNETCLQYVVGKSENLRLKNADVEGRIHVCSVCVCVLCCVKWVRLDQDRVQWWGLANLLMSNWIVENPLTS
jgi:hypothetical protein